MIPGSNKKFWWICEKGHEWEESVRVRCKGSVNLDVLGCPYCSGHRLNEENNFGVNFPELATQWHPTKNKKTSYEVMPGSHEKVWWQCKRGHEWRASVNKRTGGRNCPECFLKTSFPEQAVYYYVKQLFPNAKNRYKEFEGLEGLEIDIYIEELNLAIEYDGGFYHANRFEDDLKKNELIEKNGLFLIRIREEGLPFIDIQNGEVIFSKASNLQLLSKAIQRLFVIIGQRSGIKIPFAINVKKDQNEIMNKFIHREIQGSLVNTHPEVISFWHEEKNENLQPYHFTSGSDRKVWWQCGKGHEWEASIEKIANRGHRCPYCSNKKVGPDNNLAFRFPEVAKEWHPTKNGDLRPEDVTYGSHKKVWWMCEKGHEWQNKVNNRTGRRQSCADCHGRGRVTLTIEDVKKKFLENGCELLADAFINQKTKMFVLCSCGSEGKWSVRQLKKGTRCRTCQKRMKW